MGIKKTYTCIMCKELVTRINTTERFCSSRCMGQYTWENNTKIKILNGLHVSIDSLRKYLNEIYRVCGLCGMEKVWNNEPLTFQMDHIDGNSDNNDLKNLRLLCPNCHTQTPTFGSKRGGNRIRKQSNRNTYLRKMKYNKNSTTIVIDDSGIENMEDTLNKFKNNDTLRKIKKIDKPSKLALEELIDTYPVTAIATVYNIHQNTVRRWMTEYGIPFKPKIYWSNIKNSGSLV